MGGMPKLDGGGKMLLTIRRAERILELLNRFSDYDERRTPL